MKKQRISNRILLPFTLLIGLFAGWLIFDNQEPITSNHNSSLKNKEPNAVWTCSMHPQIRQNEPGDCPICGMELIPLKSNSQQDHSLSVRMSPTAMELAKVETMVVGKSEQKNTIRLNGKVESDERLRYTQSSHIPGRIEKLNVNFTGEFVKKGQVIALLYSPELVTAQKELFEAKKVIDKQPELYRATVQKLKNWKITKEQISQLENSEKTIEQFPILANTSGYVLNKKVNQGDYVKAGTPLFEIADLSKVWILFDVYESEMTDLNVGDSVSYTLSGIQGKVFKGLINYIDPVIDPKMRVAKARVESANPLNLLKPNMFAVGIVEPNNQNTPLAIPRSAVMWTGKRSVVYVMSQTNEEVYFTMRIVTLGADLDQSYVIESGLKPGEVIAVNGTFSIDAAAQLEGKPSMMNPDGVNTMNSHQHGEMAYDSKNISYQNSSPAIKKLLFSIFNDYFTFVEALTRDNFQEAQNAGASLRQNLQQMNFESIDDGNNENLKRRIDNLIQLTNHINHSKELGEFRNTLQKITPEFIGLERNYNPINKTLFVQYCPMANNNNGGLTTRYQ